MKFSLLAQPALRGTVVAMSDSQTSFNSAGKPQFANRVLHFAKQHPGLQAAKGIAAGCIIAMLAATLTGAFGTYQMSIGQRASFWAVLMAFNAAKWIAWFGWRVRSDADWWPAAILGTILLAIPLPLEIDLAYRLVGAGIAVSSVPIWQTTAALGVLILLALWLAIGRRGDPGSAEEPADGHIFGPLSRAGITPEAVSHVVAEDHYCRVVQIGAPDALILARITDIDRELAKAGVDGMRIHRSAWASDREIVGAMRDGRRWTLITRNGERLGLSSTYRVQAKARGWLNR